MSDIVIAELDVIALALRVSKERPDLLILLMTGYSAERHRAHDLDVVIRDVISKPFALQHI